MPSALLTAEPAAWRRARPTAVQRAYLRRGLDQPGGKLPLFDRNGQRYPERTIRACIELAGLQADRRGPRIGGRPATRLTGAERRVSP